MKNYYDMLISDILTALEEKDYDKASKMIEEEFRMPYIPLSVENQLKELKKKIPVKEQETHRILTDENLKEYLYSSEDRQLSAITYLDSVNVRKYLDLIQNYLNSNASRLLKGLLISTLIRQEITAELEMTDGQRYQFIPASLELPEESEGVQKAYQLIRKLLSNENPTGENLCFEVLLKEAYLRLPQSFEEEESEMLAYGVIKAVYLALGDEDGWKNLSEEYNINPAMIYDINI